MALAATLIIGMIVPVAAQLANGDFENNPQTTGYTYVNSPSYIDLLHTWKVTLGSVNVGTTPAGTSCVTSGGHCIDLNGDRRGRIEQVISTIAGSTCGVTFFMSRHVSLASGSATLNAVVNHAATPTATFVHSTGGVIPTDGRWQQHSFTFTTVGSSTTLAFESAIQGAAGPQIDNVTMKCDPPPTTGSLTVRKVVVNTLGVPTPATFNVMTHCSLGAATPVNTPVSVPAGQGVTLATPIAATSSCSVTEALAPPVLNVRACNGGSASWTANYSAPVTIAANGTAVLTVTNTLTCEKPTGTACLKYTPNNTACRLALLINRAKGPNTYTVTVTPAAITPSLNMAPSSASSCVSAGGSPVLQTSCAFFYNSSPTSVTLTATSSAGPLPTGFAWSGACSGSSATCLVSVTQSPVTVGASFPP
jgi:hypothetical protein